MAAIAGISTNHGGPAGDEKSKSCILLNHNETLCDQDLADIFKKLKPEVMVAVFAEGCFSGGFAKLASANVCVATTADQNLIGIGERTDRASIWKLMAAGQVNKFEDLSKVRARNQDVRYRTGTDTMKIESCSSITDKIQSSLAQKFKINFRNEIERALNPPCYISAAKKDFNSQRLLALWTENNLVPHIFSNEMAKEICDAVSSDARGKEICDGWKELVPEKSIQKMLALKADVDAKKAKLVEVLKMPTFKSNLDGKSYMQFRQEVLEKAVQHIRGAKDTHEWIHTWDWYRGSGNVDKRAREIMKAYHEYTWASNTIYFELAKNPLLAKDDPKSLATSAFIRECLFYGNYPAEMKYINDYNRTHEFHWKPRIKFSSQQLEEAKKCESNFQF